VTDEPGGDPPVVTLYTTASCGLCAEARAELERLAERLLFRLEVTAVDPTSAGQAGYGSRVPVVELGGEEIASAPIRKGVLEESLRRALLSRR